jgi:DNA-binding winged helix-turn-helix (wHTH) protein
VPLAPKTSALLHYLASSAGRLVPKQELLDAVWPGVFVGDAVLKVAVRDVRRSRGGDSHAPRFIETAHGRGYRFFAAVATEDRPVDTISPALPARGSPRVSYARSGAVNIAYEVAGSGLTWSS